MTRHCSPGRNKKFAKVVNGKCVRFGDPNMTIKKPIQPGKKRFALGMRVIKKQTLQHLGTNHVKNGTVEQVGEEALQGLYRGVDVANPDGEGQEVGAANPDGEGQEVAAANPDGEGRGVGVNLLIIDD